MPSLLNADAAATTATVTAAAATTTMTTLAGKSVVSVRDVGPRGTPTQMQFTTLGGWTVLVQEKDRVFHLHLVP